MLGLWLALGLVLDYTQCLLIFIPFLHVVLRAVRKSGIHDRRDYRDFRRVL